MFDERLRQLRLNRNLNMRQTASLLGIPYTTYVGYEKNEREPNSEALMRIASFFNCTVDYLMGLESDSSPEPTPHEDLDSIPGILHPVMRKIPLLGKTACGEPIYSPNYDDGYALLNEDYEADFALQAQGDSMTGAGIQSGDIVFFIAQETVDNGQIAAVFIDEEVTLKRVYYYKEKNKLILQPENPAYEPLVYVGEELDSIRIIGRAVAHLRRL